MLQHNVVEALVNGVTYLFFHLHFTQFL